MKSDELLHDLTAPQRDAVTHVDGPLLIVAGAGSGKTRVITRRVAHLISLSVRPNSILAITFTNKAAGEMKSRISSLLTRPLRDFGKLDQPWPIICTFHSLALRTLRHFAQRLDLPPNFSIYDSSDQERMIKEAIKSAELSTTNFPVAVVHAKISDAKNALIGPEEFTQSARDFFSQKIARIYKHYQKLLEQNNALDFDDLLMKTAHAFRSHRDVLEELQDRFQYILIDEYQDTNHSQYMIAHLLAMKHKNICVVGDPDQSIYAWRGADIRNILEFEKDYPKATVIHLEQNYRSTQTILHIASELISHNRQRMEKRLWTENDAGRPATVYLTSDEHQEAAAVMRHFKQLNEKGIPWNQMAVFYRMNSLMRVMEDSLRRAGIPYRVARGIDFYHRKEIKDVLAYLRVVANPHDELSLERIVNIPARGISDATVKQLQLLASTNGTNLWETMQQAQNTDLSTRAQLALRQFVQLVERWRALNQSRPLTSSETLLPEEIPGGGVRELMDNIVKTSGLEAYLKKVGGEEREELANVEELISSAAEYDQENPEGNLDDYLSRISLLSDVDGLKDVGGAVTLMTLHAAKGLEFPVVAIIGMEEGILPHARVREHPEQVEEERRLCFVGITRAQNDLILSRARFRVVRGFRDRTSASRFLGEMPEDALSVIDVASDIGGELDYDSQEHADHNFRPGQLVRHPKFGVGKITEISGTGQHTRAVVDFKIAGRRILILESAPLEAAS